MKSWVWRLGRFAACDSVPLSDRGFRYGMSVFESFPVQDGAPLFLASHLARLRDACACCAFEVDPAALDACDAVLRRAGDGFARIYVTAGSGPADGMFDRCGVYVFIEPREPAAARAYDRGYDLGISPEPHHPVCGGLKTGNYWANLAALRAGAQRGKNETLLCNPDGRLISACMASVFVVKNNALLTPKLSTGARAGVVREWVMRRREVVEADLTQRDCEEADEIFLTSSWLGIMPAASLETRRLASRAAASALRAEYLRAIASK